MRCPVDRSHFSSATGYVVVRLALGLVLLLAAGLKAHQLSTGPVGETWLLDSRWFLIAVVEFELLFGLWLLAGIYPRLTWKVAVATFAWFAAVSLYLALSGQASCGCLGRVPVNPWYMLGFDAAATLALLCCRPAPARLTAVARARSRVLAGAAVVAVWLMVGIPLGLAMGSYTPSLWPTRATSWARASSWCWSLRPGWANDCRCLSTSTLATSLPRASGLSCSITTTVRAAGK